MAENRKEGMTDRVFWEVYPKSAWNYAILGKELKEESFNLRVSENIPDNPWNLKNAPIQIRVKAVRLPEWRIEIIRQAKCSFPRESKGC